MAIGHAAAGRDQRLDRGCKLFERRVTGRRGDPGGGAGAEHLGLEIGDFDERFLDTILDGADLGSDFVGGVFDDLFALDFSLPRRVAAGGPVAQET